MKSLISGLLLSAKAQDVIPDGVFCETNFGTEERIVGGVEAEPHSWNWIVSLQTRSGFHFCGGSIINSEWIVTAAHCLDGSDFDVVAGLHDVTDFNAGQRSSAVEQFPHPDYNKNTFANDVALLRIDPPLSLGGNVGIACFPEDGQDPALAENCFTAGWGTLEAGGDSPDKLMSVGIDLFTDALCNDKYGQSNYGDFTAEMICGGKPEGGKDACQGDSGGPMVCIDSNLSPVLHGLTSWGFGCAEAAHPGVYTEVSNYIGWMKGHVTGTATTEEPRSTAEPFRTEENTGEYSSTTGSWSTAETELWSTTTSTTTTTTTTEPIICPEFRWKGGKVSKAMFTSGNGMMVRVNVKNDAPDFDTFNDEYFGFLGFAKRNCGVDFTNALDYGDLQVEIYDFGAYYSITDNYTRWDGRHTATWLQFAKSVPEAGEKDLPQGTQKKDQFYLTISGLDYVDFGSKDAAACLESVYVGAARKPSEEIPKFAKCASEDKILGW